MSPGDGDGGAGGAPLLTAKLVPHAGQAPPPPQRESCLRLHARAERIGAELRLAYALSGPLEGLRIPPPDPRPRRRDGLWRHTCLEAFLAVADQEGYWELNLAPAGHWNLYRLDGYRRNLRPEPAAAPPQLVARHTRDGFELRAALPLAAPLAEAAAREVALEMALTAVLEHADGGLSYWALAHPAGEPDFHWRGGWRRCR